MRSSFVYFLLTILLCSCNSSRIPEPVAHLYSQQQKMQASHHWEVLAADLANQINNQLIMTDNIYKTVFVKETCGDEMTACNANETSSFNEAFRDLLITNLYQYGVPTMSRPTEEAIIVNYKVQLVRHNSRRIRSLQPGILTALSAGVMVFRNAPMELLIIASGAVADLANTNLVLNGHYEVIITTSMVQKERYLFRASDIYYINDKDFYHYQQNMAQGTTIKITGSKTEPVRKASTPAAIISEMPFPPAKEKEEEEANVDKSNI